MANFYLLKEDDGRLEKEDSTGFLLLEQTATGATAVAAGAVDYVTWGRRVSRR